MGKKVITVNLSTEGIDKAISQLNQYTQGLTYKADLLRRKLAERIEELCSRGFENSYVDDIVNGVPRGANVEVNVIHMDRVSVVVAHGEDAIWVEFGAGVFHNGQAGSSPNPNGPALGYTIGSYGKGKGKQPAWGFRGEDGEVHITRGTEATMPMYHAMRSVESEIYQIAREVFR